METTQRMMSWAQMRLFKSYYVVWKQIAPKPDLRYFISLNRTMQYGNAGKKIIDIENIKKFKSYYVVWKLPKRPIAVISGFCLNRTMQYGNCLDLYFTMFIILFKSYYVVWKHRT